MDEQMREGSTSGCGFCSYEPQKALLHQKVNFPTTTIQRNKNSLGLCHCHFLDRPSPVILGYPFLPIDKKCRRVLHLNALSETNSEEVFSCMYRLEYFAWCCQSYDYHIRSYLQDHSTAKDLIYHSPNCKNITGRPSLHTRYNNVIQIFRYVLKSWLLSKLLTGNPFYRPKSVKQNDQSLAIKSQRPINWMF